DLAGKVNLPTETVLAEQYRCSRPTLRKALGELKQAGYVTSVKGSGAYINAPAPANTANNGKFFGIIFPNLGPGYFLDPLGNQLAQYASLQGYSLVWGGYISPKSETLKLDILRICERYIWQRIEGLFFAPFEYHDKRNMINAEIAATISYAGIPIVLIDSNTKAYPEINGFDLVSMDHVQASYILTEHIIHRGFRRVFFLAPPFSHHTIKLRLMGYHEALLDHHLEPEALVELPVDDLALVSGFVESKKPDAVICSNDVTAMSLITSFEKMGLRVPGDIAVAGFDHLSKVIPFSRPVTSIEQPVAAIAQNALELMINRIANPEKAVSQRVFSGKLIIEATTDPLDTLLQRDIFDA
ncbi:MAG: LacI family transcriptional regulator, partial [Treponema sp.]|nr:LacI family transcriptional regulator [Treponema sp.]